MSEIMHPQPFGKLMRWALAEYRQQGRVFGIRREAFYQNTSGRETAIFGQGIASPIGPAAGPNSQLAQNIVAAWLCGSRFIELKTVQKMDGAELRACVPRPCITAEDEGYNVEWSTELTVDEALGEYVKAWVAVHVLAKEFGIAGGAAAVFNMSVGYDLEGIKTPKIDAYIEGMKNAAETPVFRECMAWLRENAGLFQHAGEADFAAVPAQVSASVTLSTLHGCPPAEIERIAKYLLGEKKVHTFVKCNPTLLGYETARRLLDEMGYGYVSFDDHHFKNDLQYPDALAMLGRLMEYAAGCGLSFGVKITNTFPVKIEAGTLPGEEMYMSGRALFPLSISVAAKLAKDFGGKLSISYSGGADYFNIAEIYKTGIRPITVATTILKPGGYERMGQLAAELEPLTQRDFEGIDVAALTALASKVTSLADYRKEKRPAGSRKTSVPLPLFDCFQAPCKEGGCPIGQQVPQYLRLIDEGDWAEAFRVIAIDNPVPAITGTICPHSCQGKCTRLDYDEPLEIRRAKLLAGEKAQAAFTAALAAPPLATGKKAVVVGAGPGGVAAALFLRRAGMAVTVLDKRERPFGIVEYVIPAFRIPPEAMKRDFDMARKMGVEFCFGQDVQDLAALRAEYDYVVLAVGAWRECAPAVADGQQYMLDALAFLEESKAKNCEVPLGKRVAVIGGGDVAMDCARAAKRAPGVESVTLVYRRTRAFMPASAEEINLALADGVELVELHAPLRYNGDTLYCERMDLGEWDASGRRGIVGTGEETALAFDKVICAVGARVDGSLFAAAGLKLNERGLPVLSAMNESSLPGVYVAGDCTRGPATVVAAVADAKRVAADICLKNGLATGFAKAEAPPQNAETLYARKGLLRRAGGEDDAGRCLGCDTLCEVCCDVCPNRANVRIPLPGFGNRAQIVHLDALCNECGNCAAFCPHTGKPYKDKFTLFAGQEDFDDSANTGFLPMANGSYTLRLESGEVLRCELSDARVPPKMAAVIRCFGENYSYYL